jgi:hypothetical protein
MDQLAAFRPGKLCLVSITKKRGYNDESYTIGLGSEKVHCFASSEAQARQRAIEHFRPSKRQLNTIWVCRA